MIRKTFFFMTLITTFCFAQSRQQRLDAWSDIMYSLAAATNPAANVTPNFAAYAFELDYVNKQTGSFGIFYDGAGTDRDFFKIGFVPGEHLQNWNIKDGDLLRFWAKIEAENTPDELVVEFVDKNRQIASFSMPINGRNVWQLFEYQLSFDSNFDSSNVMACQFTQEFIKDAKIWFDDVHFYNPAADEQFGITSKPLEQRIAEAAHTRQVRSQEAFGRFRKTGLREGFKQMLSNLAKGKNLDQTNRDLYDVLSADDYETRYEYRLEDHWCLVVNQILYRMYFLFGANGSFAPGRLYPETEKALLAELWDRTVDKNDIALTRQSTWWMIGSENHDVVGKVSNLIASKIFMNEPDYKDRIYPNLGKGGSYAYWFDQMYSDDRWKGPHGRANLSDGKDYNSGDHYKAWVEFFKEYIRQRLQRGFFLEVFSSGYMGVTISHFYDLYDLCGDAELKELTGDFLDAIWADWAQDTISGVKGGSKTRAAGLRDRDSMYIFSQFEFGGRLLDTGGNMWVPLFTDYRFPEIVWQLALDRESLGSFEYISRRPGEEEDIVPRPLGTERSMICDTHTRFVRYCWVTPDYVLGCQMDHPNALHSHLSVARRWQGLTFASNDNARLFPCKIDINSDGDWRADDSAYFRNFQKNNIMIAQQSRRWNQANPDWFPAGDMYSQDIGFYFGDNLDLLEEKGGWIFAVKNNAYAAVKVVYSDMHLGFRLGEPTEHHGKYARIVDDCYKWNDDRTMIKFIDKFSPVIIHAARSKDYDSFEEFQNEILSNQLRLIKTVVSGWYIVEYKSLNADGEQDIYYFNAANNEVPQFNGEYVDYSPPWTFKSPFIRSEYNSGIIEVKTDQKYLLIKE